MLADAFTRKSGRRAWVHCTGGVLVLAFLYRYRCKVLCKNREAALWDLRENWEPFGVWEKFTFVEDEILSHTHLASS